mgnify:CR=1 FL=1
MIDFESEKKPKVIEIPITLTPAQESIDQSEARFKVVESGRRSGKSEYAIYSMIKKAAKPHSINWLVAPSYRQAKEISWRKLLALIPDEIIKSTHGTDLTIEFKNRALIQLKGSENEQSLRGVGLDYCVFEEAAYLKGVIWTDIIRPTLADKLGTALFISTPKGRNWFHKLYEYALQGRDQEWQAWHFTIYDNPHISAEEILKIKSSAEISELTWRQEYLAEVFANVGQVYGEFDEASGAFCFGDAFIGHENWNCVLPIDWGLQDDTACVWLHIHPITGHIIVSHEHSRNSWPVVKHTEIIKAISRNRKIARNNHVLDRTAFRKEGTSNTTIAQQFHQEGVSCVPSEKDVDVGINVVKRFLQGDAGGPFVHISSSCPKLIAALKEWEYGDHEPDVLAAFRYGVMHIYKHRLSNVFANDDIELPNERESELVKIGADGTRYLRVLNSGDLQWDYGLGVPSD